MFLWNKLAYHKRLFAWLVCYSLLLAGCLIAFQYRREKQFKAENLNAQLQLVNRFILSEMTTAGEWSDGGSVSTAEGGAAVAEAGGGVSAEDIRHIVLAAPHPFDDLRVSIIDHAGEIVYDNSLDSLPHSNHLNREEIASAIQTGSGYTLRRHSESTGDYYFYSALRGESGYIVRTAVPYSVSLNELLRADYGFIYIMLGITILMCLLGFVLTRRLGEHVSRLNRFAQSVENGDKISNTAPFPHDELGEISNHIVRLYARLQQAQSERDEEHRSALYEQQEKERLKKQLTNNINHELKTPVASIQVCLETLLAHENLEREKQKEFLERCLVNTGRLKQLLSDVSLITRMDDGRASITKTAVDLRGIIEDVCRDAEAAAKEKGITIEHNLTHPLPMTGNEPLLASIFHNLIDNAIAYCGGTQIVVRLLSETDDKLTFSVADNGVGVAEEHLSRLFERFYRVDKGRSRAAGGTGLGLSIVKNAVLLHGGHISVENRREGGLLFRLALGRG